MEQRLVNLIIGSLLHDVGKIVYRSGEPQNHSTLGWKFLSELEPFKGNHDLKDCILYHHGRDLSNAKIADDSLAYITYIADNISAAGDRRTNYIEGEEKENNNALFDKFAPLESVFNILNGNNENHAYHFRMLNEINYPTAKRIPITSGNYGEIKIKLEEQLKGIELTEEYINSILHLLEATTSFVPSSTNTKELADISLYDHSKMTVAIASCLYHYTKGKNLKQTLFQNEKEFKKKEAFLLFSFDISGIQSYIYTISGTEALKSLRARSLYLELLLENIADELLTQTSLTRCNLIYTGGGHAYILLPNTREIRNTLKNFELELRIWFLDNFDISLYVACGYAKCTSKELASDIGKVYQRLENFLAIKKSQRYSPEDIIGLNNGGLKKEERECRECYKSGEVSDEGKCEICQALIELSPRIIREDSVFVVKDKFEKILPRATLALPFNRSITLKSIDDARKDNYVRVYSKNQPSMGQSFATNLWIGDYSVKSNKGLGSKDFEEFAKESKGIDRVAVLRADVDDLGKAFISGFKDQKDGIVVKNSMRKYETISRTSTLSRHLSMFFKFYINKILKDYNRNALIVYSGGDDMFIAGSWDDIIDLAKDIRDAFIRYTQGTLTLSAGIGIYNHSYPISRMATEVGDLENAAKVKDEDKNKVTLFREGRVDEYNKTIDEDWVLSWGQLPSFTPQEDEAGTNSSITNSGIQEKLDMLNKTFKRDKQNGKAFLYKMLEFIRECQSDKINIARYAYLLRRAEERNKNLDVTTFYKWIQDSNGRKELEVAITLYSYLTRK